MIRKNAEVLFFPNKEIALEMNGKKSRCMFLLREQNGAQTHNISNLVTAYQMHIAFMKK
jgi:hypothetical protein